MDLIIELLWKNRKRIKKLGKGHPEVVSLVWLSVAVVALWRALIGVQKHPLKIVHPSTERKDGDVMDCWLPVAPLKVVKTMDEPRIFTESRKLAH